MQLANKVRTLNAMFSLRSIAVIIAVALLVSLFSRLARKKAQSANKPDRKAQIDQMKKCKLCGVFTPEDETTVHNGQNYCCKKHALKDPHS